ncbi:heavy-metal-associated domain-containing protein [Uliginosibacterium sp. sgz301328]|uniref:heavy-metal-associated domain-containing protein n=1 Tax=Uliginosibacterium sp. sgz301328 TaxID=3243764 RepID=UPI00359E8A91
MQSLDFSVQGMSCGGCVSSVTRVLSAFDGVEDVKVSLETARASMHIDSAKVTPEQLKQAVRDAGFEAQ